MTADGDEEIGFMEGLLAAAKARLAELQALPSPTAQELQFIADLEAIPGVLP